MGASVIANQSSAPASRDEGIFASYAALAVALISDVKGACLLGPDLGAQGEFGLLSAAAAARWLKSTPWVAGPRRPMSADVRGARLRLTAIPLERSDAGLLATFCIAREIGGILPSNTRDTREVAQRLKPLLDCIQRDLLSNLSIDGREQELTEQTADLEWLFGVSTKPHRGGDDRRLIEELLSAATQRFNGGLGVLFIPDKRMTVMSGDGGQNEATLRQAWEETKAHLLAWVQRRHKPLVVNRVGHGDRQRVQCKVLCVPIITDGNRVIGAVAFFNDPSHADFPERHVVLAQHLGRQFASIVDAQFDLMTGLYTSGGLAQMVAAFDENSSALENSLLYVDIDHMHVLNELHSFDLGNELIIRVADLLAPPLLPPHALAARISGDRFAIVLQQTSAAAAVAVAESILAAVSKIVIGPSKETMEISVSIGVSGLLPLPDGLARAVASAEIACKTAKNRGRNRVEVYAFEDSSMMRRHADALSVAQLRSALKSDRLLLYAQRIEPLQNKSLPGGYEILLRLQEVDGSLVAPGPLIEAAQRYQILPTVDRWVMSRTLQMLSPFRSMLRSREIGMSINVSGQSMSDDTFLQQFLEALKSADLPKSCVSLELTEQAAINNLALAHDIVERLAKAGCRFALDDFGTGANSLAVCKSLGVYRVKIDGSFVRDLLTNRNSAATVRGIVELAKGRGIETVAEYVENMQIASELTRLGVDYAQGYAFGKPEPLKSLLDELSADESKRLHKLFLDL